MKKNLLITGGAGFVGANLAVFLSRHLKGYRITCFDNLIRKGSLLNVARLKENGVYFIKGDIRDKKKMFTLGPVHLLIDCSAEPAVLAAYRNPSEMIDTNLIGTVHCLDLARRYGADFIFLSTSRVYPIEAINAIPARELKTRFDWKKDVKRKGFSYKGIAHEFSLEGVRSLYGASKLCSECLAAEYFDMFSLKGIINRLGIIAGPWQMGKVDQGIIAYWLARHKFGGKLQYIGYGGTGKQVRDAVHIDDVCRLVLHQIRHMKDLSGKTFNVGGGRKNSFSLLELTGLVSAVTRKSMRITSVRQERKADIRIYITDNSYITQKTGWQPKKNLEDIVVDTDNWIQAHSQALRHILA